MKIRLRVRTSPTESFEWEHPGPSIRTGKEGCQLAFPGDPNVCGRHAEIELSATGAVLRDAGSTNGTYLNGAPLSDSTRLSVGDQVTLGLAGPRLDILSLDLAATTAPVFTVRRPPPPRPLSHATAHQPAPIPRPLSPASGYHSAPMSQPAPASQPAI